MMKTPDLKDNLEHLGIDWKKTKIDEFQKLLEEFGYEKLEYVDDSKVKEKIIEMLKMSKTEKIPPKSEMNKIFTKINECDHHDLCRLDQILTRIKNTGEDEIEWGSLILNCKWKKL